MPRRREEPKRSMKERIKMAKEGMADARSMAPLEIAKLASETIERLAKLSVLVKGNERLEVEIANAYDALAGLRLIGVMEDFGDTKLSDLETTANEKRLIALMVKYLDND